MNEDYGACPKCGEKKIYLSKAMVLVCGNKKCGMIFLNLGSKQHLQLRQQLASAMDMLEDYEKFRKLASKKLGLE